MSISITPKNVNVEVNRNDRCPCDSGVKVKKCCGVEVASSFVFEETSLKRYIEEKFKMVSLTCHSTEQLKQNSSEEIPTYYKSCGKKSLYWRSKDVKTGEEREKIIRYRCKSWRCEICRQGLAQKEYRKLEKVVSSPKNWVAVMLTFDPKKISKEEAEKKEGEIWNKFKICLQRKIGKFEFYWAREWQQNGMLHKHLIIYSPELYRICEGVYDEEGQKKAFASEEGEYYEFKSWFEEKLERYGYGKTSGVQRVRGKEAVVKYIVGELTKSYQKRGDYRRGLRMHGHSRGFYKLAEGVEGKDREEGKKCLTLELAIVSGEIEELKEYVEGEFEVKNEGSEMLYKMNDDGKVEWDSVGLKEFWVVDRKERFDRMEYD